MTKKYFLIVKIEKKDYFNCELKILVYKKLMNVSYCLKDLVRMFLKEKKIIMARTILIKSKSFI